MDINELVGVAMAACRTEQGRDWTPGRRHGVEAQNSLAMFIASELRAVCQDNAPHGDQLASAVKAMQGASDELADIAEALSHIAVARAA